jgi:hypothetical protein
MIFIKREPMKTIHTAIFVMKVFQFRNLLIRSKLKMMVNQYFKKGLTKLAGQVEWEGGIKQNFKNNSFNLVRIIHAEKTFQVVQCVLSRWSLLILIMR